MKNFLSFFGLFIALGSWAQITVTDADFPSGGDTAMVTISNETVIDLVTTGNNVTWDFSLVSIDNQRIDTFFDISSAEAFYQLVFNNQFTNPDYASEYFLPWVDGVDFSQASQFGLSIEDPVNFTKIDAGGVEQVGFGLKINGIAVPASSDTIDVQYQLPLTYSDSWISNSYTNLDLNPQFNGIYRRYTQRNSIVDGWGQIITPNKTYDAVRVKSLVSTQDSVYIDIGFGGMWIELPTPDRIEYDWIANNEKISVFKVVTQDIVGTETVTTVEFKDKKRDFASIEDEQVNVGIYPNPATDQFQINAVTDIDQIEVLDVNGKIVFSEMPNAKITTVDVSSWAPGLYVVKLKAEDKITIKKMQVQ